MPNCERESNSWFCQARKNFVKARKILKLRAWRARAVRGLMSSPAFVTVLQCPGVIMFVGVPQCPTVTYVEHCVPVLYSGLCLTLCPSALQWFMFNTCLSALQWFMFNTVSQCPTVIYV